MAKDVTNTTIDDVNNSVADQLSSLRAEVERLSAALKERGSEFIDDASDQFDEFADEARHSALVAASHVRHEAVAAAGAVKDHPVSAAAAATTFIGIGFAIGYLLGATTHEKRRSFW